MIKYLDPVRLRSGSEEELLTALKSALDTNEDGDLMTSTHDYFVDVIGMLYAKTGTVIIDDNGNEYPETEALEGYHANLKTRKQSHIDSLSDFIIDVDNPLRKIAGE